MSEIKLEAEQALSLEVVINLGNALVQPILLRVDRENEWPLIELLLREELAFVSKLLHAVG